MLKEDRHKYILDMVNKNGSAKISELSAVLKATEMTLRRDLKYLEGQGLLQRTHGGALKKGETIFNELSLNEKRNINKEKKIEIAKVAASLINDDDIVYIGPGTTNEYIYDYITANRVKVISNCLNIFDRFKDDKRFEFILVGGKFRTKTNAFVGTFTNDILNSMRVKTAFIGANGIYNNEVLTSNEDEGICQKTIMNKAIRRFLLCDTTKVEKEDFFTLYRLEDVTALITDSSLADDLYKKYSEYCEVIRGLKGE